MARFVLEHVGSPLMSAHKPDQSTEPTDGTWYPIHRGRDRAMLRAHASKLELRWPDCYETRITEGLDTGEFMLSVRHRD